MGKVRRQTFRARSFFTALLLLSAMALLALLPALSAGTPRLSPRSVSAILPGS